LTLLLQLLLATGIIALMIVVRIVANRQALRQRLLNGEPGHQCTGTCGRHHHDDGPEAAA